MNECCLGLGPGTDLFRRIGVYILYWRQVAAQKNLHCLGSYL